MQENTNHTYYLKICLEKFDKKPALQIDMPVPTYKEKINIPIRKIDSWAINQIVELKNSEKKSEPLTRSRLLIILLNSALRKQLLSLPLDAQILVAKNADNCGRDSINPNWTMDVLESNNILSEATRILECNGIPKLSDECDGKQKIASREYLTIFNHFGGGL